MNDIITIVFRDEISILKLQAQSIEHYCNADNLGRIIVVINDDTLDVDSIDPHWWGELHNRVDIVHRSRWAVNYAKDGWLTQQLLKILATELCISEWSIILDAKTLFVRSVPKVDSKPHVGELDIHPVFKVSQQRVSELFGINLIKLLGPGGVPFIFNNQLVQDMINEIQTRTNQKFADWFQAQGMITEFILYSAFLQYKYGGFYTLYDPSFGLSNINVCHSEVALFDDKLNSMKHGNTLSVSVHRNAWSKLTSSQQKSYQDFLMSRGIE